jgi:hypothetical protein
MKARKIESFFHCCDVPTINSLIACDDLGMAIAHYVREEK